jgi:hypothetical protein
MRRVSDWRSQETASDFETHDRADLAQEFLCRNPRYERDLADTTALIDAIPAQQTSEWEGLARRWGLSFPLRGRPVANFASGALVVRNRAKRRHPRYAVH